MFFAIAISDVRLHEIEKDMVIKAITGYRRLLEPDDQRDLLSPEEYGENMLITISEEYSNAWELFENFEEYYRNNQSEFSDNSQQWIIAKANEIASSYAQQNKSEIVLIARLRLLFNKT